MGVIEDRLAEREAKDHVRGKHDFHPEALVEEAACSKSATL